MDEPSSGSHVPGRTAQTGSPASRQSPRAQVFCPLREYGGRWVFVLGLVVFLGWSFGLSGVRMEPLAEPGLQNVRVGLFIASGEEEAGVGECSRSPRSRLPLRTARVAGLKRCGATRPLPPRPTEVPTGRSPRVLAQAWLRGRPCPVAGRSLRASMPFALSAPLSLSPSYPALTGEAGSRSTDDPSLQSVGWRERLCWYGVFDGPGVFNAGQGLAVRLCLAAATRRRPQARRSQETHDGSDGVV